MAGNQGLLLLKLCQFGLKVRHDIPLGDDEGSAEAEYMRLCVRAKEHHVRALKHRSDAVMQPQGG